MSALTLSQDAQADLVQKLKVYFEEKLDHEIGSFDAEFLIDFLCSHVGPEFYNEGLRDANALFAERAEELSYLLQDLEKPPNTSR